MESKKWWLVISALVVAAAATNINRFDQDEYDGLDEDDGFDEYDEPENNNVTEHGGRKGKICKSPFCFFSFALLVVSSLFNYFLLQNFANSVLIVPMQYLLHVSMYMQRIELRAYRPKSKFINII